jgi:hypothetical protein
MTDEYLHFCTQNLSGMITDSLLSVDVSEDLTSQLAKNERL